MMTKKKTGKVFLVGVGPGNEQLITAAGLECLRRADVLVYDQLMSPSLLEYRKPGAVLLYAGKSPGRHSMSQPGINRLLCEQAKQHATVARLKGGDPFLFGRGSEEALALVKAGIDFEVVPGVSSGFAVAAYAGIPLTHRGIASQVTFVTGHEDPANPEAGVDWGKLATLKGTLVIFMGMARLASITRELIAQGMDTQTPVCVTQWGTLPLQRSVCATLATIHDAIKKQEITHPAIIIIGDVVRLRNKLNWYESKPLFGKKILITRPPVFARELSRELERAGAQTLTYSLINVAREKRFDEKKFLEKLHDSDWVVFASRSAVDICFEVLKNNGFDARRFGKARIAVMGEGTKNQLQQQGIIADLVPPEFIMESLIEEFRKISIKGKRLFIPHSRQGRPLLCKALTRQGGIIDEMFVYHVEPPAGARGGQLKKLLEQERFDVITFTSSSCVHQFMRFVGKEKKLLRQQTFAVIGPITGAILKQYGYVPVVSAKEFSVEGLVRALITIGKGKQA